MYSMYSMFAAALLCVVPVTFAFHLNAPFDTELCKIAPQRDYPAIDLNPARAVEDYSVKSLANPMAEYVFQVCGMLKYTDKMCSTGTSICERYDKNLTSKENYGYVDSIRLAWERDGDTDALVMSMVGSPACTVDKDRESVSKIFFKCDEKGEEKPVLRAESEYGCFVEINFPTKYACNSSQPSTYKCVSGKCEAAEGGLPLGQCETVCGGGPPSPPTPPPSPVRYACDKAKGQCVEEKDGEFPTDAQCKDECKQQIAYECNDQTNQCVEKPGVPGMSKPECEGFCDKGKLYTCQQNQCKASTDGKGVDKTICEAVCGAGPSPPPPPPVVNYKCVVGKCVETSDPGVPKEACEQVCTAPDHSLYKCVQGKCVVDEKGIAKASCDAVCSSSPFEQ